MSSFNAENITFRTYTVHADLVRLAAEAKGKSVSEYCRDIVVPWAASDLDVPVPNLPEMKRGRYTELLQRAAKLTGLSPEEFERQAVERMASAALGYAEQDHSTPIHAGLQPRPATMPPPSGKRTASGTHRRVG